MRILEKYVLKSYIGAFVFCVVLLIVLGVIGDILGFLDDIFKNNIPLGSILLFYLYFAPFAFVNMVPFASLLSAVYVFNNLSKNHEVTAVITSGLSLWKLMRPVLIATFVFCLATFIVNDKLVPSSMLKADRIRKERLELGKDKTGRRIQNIAVYGKGDQIIFAKAYNPREKVLENVIVHKQNKEQDIIEKVSVREVVYQDDGKWQGNDVIIFSVDSSGNFQGEPEVYKNKIIEITENPKDFLNNQWDPRFMNYAQLRKYLKIFRKGSSTLRRLKVDLNYKLSFPFTALITVLIGVPFSISSGRVNALMGMAKGIAVAMLYLPVTAVSLALGKGGMLSPLVSAWFSIVLFSVIGIHFVNQKS